MQALKKNFPRETRSDVFAQEQRDVAWLGDPVFASAHFVGELLFFRFRKPREHTKVF
jgi:hypothetical protein